MGPKETKVRGQTERQINEWDVVYRGREKWSRRQAHGTCREKENPAVTDDLLGGFRAAQQRDGAPPWESGGRRSSLRSEGKRKQGHTLCVHRGKW